MQGFADNLANVFTKLEAFCGRLPNWGSKFVDETTRKDKMKIQPLASGSLALGGLILMGMGIYFGFLRPPLLPEDARYMGIPLAQIQSAVPGLLPWLARVFGVLAGYMFATGLLTVYVATTGFRAGRPGVTAIVAFSGLASIG